MTTTPKFNRCICPGCGADVPRRNRGCNRCGYEGPQGKIDTLAEMMALPNYPDPDALQLAQVSSLFIRRIAEIAVST